MRGLSRPLGAAIAKLFGKKMAKALQGAELSREDEVASAAAMDHWLNNGVERFRRDGRDGLLAWLGDVEHWYKRFRRKSDPHVQTFLRVFAYEAKASFTINTETSGLAYCRG